MGLRCMAWDLGSGVWSSLGLEIIDVDMLVFVLKVQGFGPMPWANFLLMIRMQLQGMVWTGIYTRNMQAKSATIRPKPCGK